MEVIEHQAHAPGHGALLLEGSRVLLAGDMLSDVEIPLLDPEADDPVADYVTALDRLAAACAGGITTVVPGHGAVVHGSEVATRFEADRAYVGALQQGADPVDRRVGPGATYGTDWLPEAHEQNVRLARRSRR